MENPQPHRVDEETFAQVLAALRDEYHVSEPKIADRIGVHVSTVNNWARGLATPRPATVQALAREYPKFKDRLFAAAKIRAPAPFRPDEKQDVLAVFARLTEEQRKGLLIQGNALAESNERQA